jgi:eukaryotic-like serine/threonine-protein kinase
MGARQSSTMRALIGSVAGEIAAHAPCTVTVVRNRYALPAADVTESIAPIG